MKKGFALALVLGLSVGLQGCTPVSIGATVGTTAGVAAAREGGIKTSLEDAKIAAKINDLWLNRDFEMFRKVNLTVDQGRVLLTGVVQKPEHRVDAVRLAWQPEGVRQVINEIKVANSEGLKGWARDNWISGRLRAAILFDKNIQSVNYSIDTVQGIIYLMGVAQNQQELDAVIAHARSVPYVRQVVSYVKLAGTPMGQPLPVPASAQTTPPVRANTAPAKVTVNPVTMGARPPVYTAPQGAVSAQPLGGPSVPSEPIVPPAGAYGAGQTAAPAGRSQPIVEQGF